jgi:hypothetical protein
LDDILTGLDEGVKRHLIAKVFNGFLKSKTVVLFTNNLKGLSFLDKFYKI